LTVGIPMFFSFVLACRRVLAGGAASQARG